MDAMYLFKMCFLVCCQQEHMPLCLYNVCALSAVLACDIYYAYCRFKELPFYTFTCFRQLLHYLLKHPSDSLCLDKSYRRGIPVHPSAKRDECEILCGSQKTQHHLSWCHDRCAPVPLFFFYSASGFLAQWEEFVRLTKKS